MLNELSVTLTLTFGVVALKVRKIINAFLQIIFQFILIVMLVKRAVSMLPRKWYKIGGNYLTVITKKMIIVLFCFAMSVFWFVCSGFCVCFFFRLIVCLFIYLFVCFKVC